MNYGNFYELGNPDMKLAKQSSPCSISSCRIGTCQVRCKHSLEKCSNYCACHGSAGQLAIHLILCDEIGWNLIEIYESFFCGRYIKLREYIERWKLYMFQQRNLKTLGSKADNYYRYKQCSFYFANWKRYVFYKRMKEEILQLSTGLYEDSLLKMGLKFWKNETSSRITDNKNVSLADEFYDNSVKRKLFKTWRRYIKRKISSRKMMYKAKFFHKMRLKQKVFNALSKNVIRCKNSDIAVQKLKLFYKRLLITSVWNEWIKLIDEKNDSELRNNLSLARSFYKENIVRKCLRNLVLHKTSELKKKALKLKLDDFCKAYYCKKYLTEWKTAHTRKKRIFMLEEKASKFYNDSLTRNVIFRWIDSYNSAISDKEKYLKSVAHYEKKLSSRYFESWIIFCNEKIRRKNLIIEATEYYFQILKRKMFNKLSANVAEQKVKERKIQIADNFCKTNLTIKVFENWREYSLQSKLLKKEIIKFELSLQIKLKQKIISQWKLYVFHKKCCLRKKSISLTYHRMKICSKMFGRLKNYVIYRREKNCRLNYLNDGSERIKFSVKRIYFEMWKVARSNVIKEKCRLFHADEFHESRLKKKYFFSWKTFFTQHRIKREHQHCINETLNNFILKKFLNLWYTRYKASSEIHFNEMWASKIYEIKMMKKNFTAWQYFTEVSKMEKKRVNNAKEFRKKLVIKEGLQHLIKLFLCNSEQRSEMKLKKNVSSELRLIRKYFDKWLEAVFLIKNKDRLRNMKIGKNFEHFISAKINTNCGKHVCDLIPGIVIPEFMKDEIRLRCVEERCSSQPNQILRSRILKAEDSLNNQKLHKNPFLPKKSGNSKINKLENDNKLLNNTPIKSKDSKATLKKSFDKKMSYLPTSTPLIISSDSLKSDLDSIKTYTVQNPVYSRASTGENSFYDELLEEKSSNENSFELLPPATFCVTFNRN